jgi:hypothetical protein
MSLNGEPSCGTEQQAYKNTTLSTLQAWAAFGGQGATHSEQPWGLVVMTVLAVNMAMRNFFFRRDAHVSYLEREA